MPDTARLHVVTGGPGSGKTTLVEALAAAGVATVPEAGRAIIRDQVTIGGRAVPWEDADLYAELMLARDLAAWRTAREAGRPVVLDRGLVDIAGYLTLIGQEVPNHVRRAVETCRYAPAVFIARPGARYTARTRSAGRTGRRRSPPTTRWSPPTRAPATRWCPCRRPRSPSASPSSGRGSSRSSSERRAIARHVAPVRSGSGKYVLGAGVINF